MLTRYNHMIASGAMTALAGFILSGPIAVITVMTFSPQPLWQSAEVFASNYHPLQHLPYFLGFILVAGMLILITGHYLNYEHVNEIRGKLLISLALTIVFSSLIVFNYICQTTFIHNLAMHYQPEYGPLISGFSMANPYSLSWAIEMWGYAILGWATYFISDCYENYPFTKRLLQLNAILSTLTALWVIYDAGWLLRPVGLALYAVWNILMIVILVSIYMKYKRKPPARMAESVKIKSSQLN